ncbi:hypothetical protein ACH4KS_27425 [Streptomyces rimosus]|uniref:hypothetical protein n=1 Tax=Streptomyces rimosus TaxID=1927 RepID=UPI003797E4C0
MRQHLTADEAYQRKLVRFLENHDEPRAAQTLHPAKERAAAIMIATLPGATLWHEGQFTGRRTRLPVFLDRRPDEPIDTELRAFHEKLLAAVHRSGMRTGQWQLLECTGWPDNDSARNVLTWCWAGPAGRFLTAVNLSEHAAQGRIRLPWREPETGSWQLAELLTGARYDRDGDELTGPGLFVDLEPWATHVLALAPDRDAMPSVVTPAG